MRLRRLYRLMMLAATGGFVFQAAASCSTDAMNTLTNAVYSAISTAVMSEITGAVSQMFTCPA